MLASEFFDHPAPQVARSLLGVELRVNGVGGLIVETEAYDALDEASHSFKGPSRRNAAMFGPAGRAYVYRIYGLHWCLNVICDAKTPGSAVLIRALQPTWGLPVMRRRRGDVDDRALCRGPGNLARALAIDGGLNEADLGRAPFELGRGIEFGAGQILAGPRIGISKPVDTPWRFGVAGSPWLSRPFAPLKAEPATPRTIDPA